MPKWRITIENKTKQLFELENLLREALKIIPPRTQHASSVLEELAYTLLDEGKYLQAEEVFKKIITPIDGTDTEDFRSITAFGLVSALTAQGKIDEAHRVWSEQKVSYYYPATIQNYRLIKELVLERGIILVAVQYPLRPVAPLKELLGPSRQIFFVENVDAFHNAIQNESFDDYFSDRFAGNFGHCTPKGNKFLAQDIAEVILNQVFRDNLN